MVTKDERPDRIPVVEEEIPEDVYRNIIEWAPSTSVEIIVGSDDGLLLCKRKNEPAKGEWFWPGTRLRKGETFEDCVNRLARDELGIDVDICCRIGTYNHYWDASGYDGVETTHTVNVVYHVTPREETPDIVLDDQHESYRWIDDISGDLHPHVRRYVEDSHISL